MRSTLEPLELLSLPPDLDGNHGTNRALGARSQIAAQTDVDAIKVFREFQDQLHQSAAALLIRLVGKTDEVGVHVDKSSRCGHAPMIAPTTTKES